MPPLRVSFCPVSSSFYWITISALSQGTRARAHYNSRKLIKEKQLIAITPDGLREVGTDYMSKVEQPDCSENYSEHFYEEKILILLIRKKCFVATIGLEDPVKD